MDYVDKALFGETPMYEMQPVHTCETKEDMIPSQYKESEDILKFYFKNRLSLTRVITNNDILQYAQEAKKHGFSLYTIKTLFPSLNNPVGRAAQWDVVPNRKEMIFHYRIINWWGRDMGIKGEFMDDCIINKLISITKEHGYLIALYIMQEVMKEDWAEEFEYVDYEQLINEMMYAIDQFLEKLQQNPIFNLLEKELACLEEHSEGIGDEFFKKQDSVWRKQAARWKEENMPYHPPYCDDTETTLNKLGMGIMKQLIKGYPPKQVLTAYLGEEHQRFQKSIIDDDFSALENTNAHVERANRFFQWCDNVHLNFQKDMDSVYLDEFTSACETIGEDLTYETFDRIGALYSFEDIQNAHLDFPHMVYQVMPYVAKKLVDAKRASEIYDSFDC